MNFMTLFLPSGYVKIAMERSTMINGRIHYVDWVIFNSYVKLPEGISFLSNSWCLREVPHGSPWFIFGAVHGRPLSKDSHDHAYAERAMVKTAERAETTQVRKAVRELGDVLYKKPHPQWAPLEITNFGSNRQKSEEIRSATGFFTS